MAGSRSFEIVFVLLVSVSMAVGCASGNKRTLTKTESSQLLIEAAQGALMENDPAGSLDNLKQASEMDDSIPQLYHVRAQAYFLRRDIPQAITDARKAVKLDSTFTVAKVTLGKLLLDHGDPAEGERFLREAIADPTYAESWKPRTAIGIAKYRKGLDSEALPLFSRAISDEPLGACLAYYYRGHILMKQKQPASAVRDYERATRRRCGAFVDAHLAMAIAFQADKKYDLARKKLLDITKQFPESHVAEQAMERLRYLP